MLFGKRQPQMLPFSRGPWRHREPDATFDYMLVAAERHDGRWKARCVNDEEIPAWVVGPNLSQYLASWGADGWEALGMSVVDSTMYILLEHPNSQIIPQPVYGDTLTVGR